MIRNIVVIICDQLRRDCLGCYGNRYIRTPHIDSIAEKGLLFRQNYVANPICMPDRLSLFTGMYPRNHGLWTNGLLIRDEGYTVMSRMQEAGIQTASIGKIHFEPNGCPAEVESLEGNARWEADPQLQNFHGPYWGYDYIELQDCHGKISHHMTKWFLENGGTEEMLADEERKIPARLHRSSFVGDRSVHYLKNIRDKNRPFFLTVSFTDPHLPFIASDESLEKRKGREYRQPAGSKEDLKTRPAHYRSHLDGAWSRAGIGNPVHPGGLDAKTTADRIQNTYAMIELIDENVGKVLAALQEEGIAEETAVIFTSDHGELLGDFGLWAKGPFYFDGLMATPLMISCPGMAAGETDALSSAVDLSPTMLDLLGLQKPFYMDGVSLLPVLKDPSSSVRDYCLIEYRNGYFEQDISSKALVTADYKYVRYQTGECELTDRKNDPDERLNHTGETAYRQTEQQLRDQLLDAILSTESKKPFQYSLA